MDHGCSTGKEHASFIAWGVENFGPVSPVADMYYPLDVVFPLRKVGFEGAEFLAPHDCGEALRLTYGDWLELPEDMFSHFRHVQLDRRALQALTAFVDGLENS